MKNHTLAVLLYVSVSSALTFVSCSNKEAADHNEPAAAVSTEEVVQRGEYLVTILGCNDCHSPKRMGAHGPEIITETMLSGYPADRPIIAFDSPLIKEGFGMFYPDLTAAAGPWGISFAANLTPDATGLGNWTEESFKIALTQGKYKGMENGRPLLPPMPWFNYIGMTDDDIHAIFTYLQQIPAVSNVVPAPVPPDMM